jgi:hypothetical protein
VFTDVVEVSGPNFTSGSPWVLTALSLARTVAMFVGGTARFAVVDTPRVRHRSPVHMIATPPASAPYEDPGHALIGRGYGA